MENENAIRDSLAADLSILGGGLKLIEKEFRLPNDFGSKGFVDILAMDQFQNYVIIEIKRTRESSRQTLQEIFKYIGLIRLNFGAKDSEIRAIIVSVDWGELFVPYCELVDQLGITVEGYRLFTDGGGKVKKVELIKPETLPKMQRRLAPIYQADMFFTKQRRDAIVSSLISMSEVVGIKDFVILAMSADQRYEIPYPFATCFGFNSLSTPAYEDMLRKVDGLDMERGEFDTEDEYRFYLEQCILTCYKTQSLNDTLEVLTPETLDSALSGRWKVDEVFRAGLFKGDPRLSDEMLIGEMKGLTGMSRTRYVHFGDSKQRARMDEIEVACLKPFDDMREWADEMSKCWKFIRSLKGPYRVVVGAYCPDAVFYGVLRFMEGGEEGYLPSYHLYIDCYDENRLYVLVGGLCWSGGSVNLQAVDGFIRDERDALFGKPIDLVNGSFDQEFLPYFELGWQNSVLISGEWGFSEGGVARISDDGHLDIEPPSAHSMEGWLEGNQALKRMLSGIFSQYVQNVTADKRKG